MGVAWPDGDWTDLPDGEVTYGNLDELGPEFVHETPERFKAHLPSGALVSPSPSQEYASTQRARAAAWKLTTATLPEEARASAPYRSGDVARPFCLPADYEAYNLLPDAREVALSRFHAGAITWHGGQEHPSNHLLSSQVQCLNALAPFADHPDALRSMFDTVLPIAEVLPFGADTASPFDRTDHVVFEWIGLADHLGERAGGKGRRGANTTSVDAAIRYVAHDGRTELALIEWKYTERYSGSPLSGGDASNALRRARYGPLWTDPDGPVRTDAVAYEDLFVEPFYQLMRQQLLAWRIDATHELGVDVARVLVVRPVRNRALLHPETGPSGLLADDRTVYDAWRAVLRRPNRFLELDSETLCLEHTPLSEEYKARYGGDA